MMSAMTRRRALLTGLAVAALLAPAVAYAKYYAVPSSLGSVLERTDDETPLAILLPNRLNLDYDGRVYASGGGERRSYSLSLSAAADCGGANACFLVTFSAERGEDPHYVSRVRLRSGRTGYFKALSCGGSCSPPAIEWRSRGNLYTIQAKVPDSTTAGQRRRLVAAANAAIGAGPR
ncbi:MAG: hypothetical protein QOI73_3609 [Solirubrobacteraceae bacterium]|nr:hypothetical protein [Solirubrobacteraceae bacterium]